MKTVYLIRHAKSSWDYSGLGDIDRPLNERGLRNARRMAQLLRESGAAPDAMMTSPALRALTTAGFFKTEFGIEGEDFLIRDEIYEAATAAILDLITMLPEDYQTVFLFGHNPTFTDVVNSFRRNFIDNLPTCGIVGIESGASNWGEFRPGNGRIKDYYFPKQF